MFSKSFLPAGALIGFYAASIALIPSVTAAPPDVTFLCGKIPEICTNMCWAVSCGSPSFSQTLTWDDPSSSVKAARRKSAGCGSGNKCNKGSSSDPLHRGAGYYSCDEYPFASTADSVAPNGHQVSRCVPGSEQNSQGGTLSAAYKRFRNQGLTRKDMRINFGNPGSAGVKYCLGGCVNDGFQIQDSRVSKRGAPRFRYYRAKSGMEMASTEDYDIGDKFERELDKDEVLPEGFPNNLVDGVIMVEDEVAEQIDTPTQREPMTGGNSSSYGYQY